MGALHWGEVIFLLLHLGQASAAVECNSDGELLPNPENCRKYFKCAQGEPSDQSCPGSLNFDPILKICNWPDNVVCALSKPKPIKLVLGEDGELTFEELASPTAPTAPPRTKEDIKRLSSLFHTKDRNFTRIRPNRVKHSRLSTPPPPTTPRSVSRNRGAQTRAPSKIQPRFSSSSTSSSSSSFSSSSSSSGGSRHSTVPVSQRKNPFSTLSKKEILERRDRFRAADSSKSREEQEERAEVQNGRRPFANGRGGPVPEDEEEGGRGQTLSEQEEEQDVRRGLFGEEEEEEEERVQVVLPKAKPTAKPVVCHTGSSNELYAHPGNCRKYYKCAGGKPSLQSCPANLIFDSNLRICNWPNAVTCEENPDAPLPAHVSSDRAPPKSVEIPRDPTQSNVINVDSDYDSVTPQSPVAFHGQGSVPSEREALEREKYLTSQYPLFKAVKHTVSTLDTKVVEEIKPGKSDNPDNVRRVEFIVTEENYNDLFPRRHKSYTYRRLLQAVGKFPAICGYLGKEEKSDAICRKTLATMFAHFAQETGSHNPSDQEFEEWRQGLNQVREQGCTETSPGCGYNSNCEDKDSITKKWACGQDRQGQWKKYYGRGAKQLSYNFNYGQFSQAMFGEGQLLLDYPDFVADTWLNLASATWFYTTPQPPKPSMLHVIDGTWQPNAEDRRNGIEPGFGATINIINGGLECNKPDGRESNQAKNRIAYYKKFAWYLYVDFQNEALGCAKQQQFSAGGAGALPIYWDKDWAAPYSCKLVNYQTAHSALVEGEYVDCVEENFKVSIR